MVFAVALAASPASFADTPNDPVRFFAGCAGRLMAQMEHEWLLSDPGSDVTEAQLDATMGLLDAMMPQGAEARVRAWRLEAKVAHQGLLQRATFQGEAWAARTARRLTSACTSLVVS